GWPVPSAGTAVESTGVTLTLVIGSVLMLVAADGLRRGRRVAWVFVTVVTASALVVALGAAPSSERTADIVLIGAQLVLLAVTYRAFSARSHRRSLRHAGWRLFWAAFALLVYTAVGFFVLQDDFTPPAKPINMLAE